jgi:hypothetical protein
MTSNLQMTTSQPLANNHVDTAVSSALPAGSFAPTRSYYTASEDAPLYAPTSSIPTWNYRPPFEQNAVTPGWQQFHPMPSAMMMYSQGMYPCFDAGSSGMGADGSYFLPLAAGQNGVPIAPQATSNLAPYRAFYPDNGSLAAQYFPYDTIPSQQTHPMRDQRAYASSMSFPAPRSEPHEAFLDPRVGEKRRSTDSMEMSEKSAKKRSRLDPGDGQPEPAFRTMPPELLASYGYSALGLPQASAAMVYPMHPPPMQRGPTTDGHLGHALPSSHVLDSLVRTSSRYRGVSLARSGHWRVQVGFMKKRLNVGHFPSNGKCAV